MRNTTIHLPLTHTSTISTARRPKLITVLAHFPHSFRSSTARGWAPMMVKRLRNLRSSRACWVRETFPRRRWRSSGRGCWSSLEAPALRATTRGGFWSGKRSRGAFDFDIYSEGCIGGGPRTPTFANYFAVAFVVSFLGGFGICDLLFFFSVILRVLSRSIFLVGVSSHL
jgi:hypothetical protein